MITKNDGKERSKSCYGLECDPFEFEIAEIVFYTNTSNSSVGKCVLRARLV